MKNSLPALYVPMRVRFAGPNPYPLHDHEFGEIFWLDKGRCEHQIRGRRVPMEVGDCVFIRPWDKHTFHGLDGKPFWLLNVSFQWFVYLDIAKRYFPQESDIYGEKPAEPLALSLDAAQLKWAREAFFELLKAPISRFHIERYLINLFAKLIPLPKDPALLGPQVPRWMQTAWHKMQEPEHLRGGIASFQRLCGRSQGHVSREFQRLTGQTLSKAINHLRITHAALLLMGTNNPVIDIAMECGFDSLSHFYLCFRRHYEISPSLYRKRAHQWPAP